MSATFCAAVGERDDEDRWIVPFAQVWDGYRWTEMDVTAIEDSLVRLEHVACTSPIRCLAIGQRLSDDALEPAAAAWNGSAWTLVESPAGVDGSLTVRALDCATATMCLAVGFEISTDGSVAPLATVWNGAAWTRAVLPDSVEGSLRGVDCPSTSTCVVLSQFQVLQLDGSGWSHLPSPPPSLGTLQDVDCPVVSECMVIGVGGAAGNAAKAARWGSSGWQALPVPVQSQRGSDRGVSVSCSAITSCAMVGYRIRSTRSGFGPRLWIWNGTNWLAAADPVTDTPKLGEALSGIDCVPEACVAVGAVAPNYGDFAGQPHGAVALEIVADTVTELRPVTPLVTMGGGLGRVSCPTSGFCAAIGDAFSRRSWTFVTVSDGEVWRTRRLWNNGATLSDVACASATQCMAVGRRQKGGPFALRWTGSGWTRATPPVGTRLRRASLSTVDCPTQRRCVALGSVLVGGRRSRQSLPVVAWWHSAHGWTFDIGTSWRGDKSGAFHDVSCGSVLSCTAVGSFRTKEAQPMTYRWDGYSWAWEVPAPLVGAIGSLSGVHCQRQTDRCAAVGHWRGGSAPLVRIRGSWTEQPRTARPKHLELSSVTCVSARRCYAAGGSHAMSWDGTIWRRDTINSSAFSYFYSVSCSGPAHCIMTGFGGTPIALAKQ